MKKWHAVFLCAATVLTGVAYGSELDAGLAAYKSGEYSKAYDLFSKAFREDPGSVEVNYALGQAAFKIEKYSHAIFAYDRVLMADPNNVKALLGKAKALQMLGQLEEAEEVYSLVASLTADDATRKEAREGVKAAGKGLPRFDLKTKASVSAIYDDNINFGPDNSLMPTFQSKETAGIEGIVDARASYDVGARKGWLLIGGASVYDSWYDVAPAQELADVRGYFGVRRMEQKSVLEAAARAEHLWYGEASLVDIYGSDLAYMKGVSASDWLITTASLEQRDYYSDFDASGARDSVHAQVGETWKHYFSNRNNNVGVGCDVMHEDAHSDTYTYLGYRLHLSGQVELPWAGVQAYAGGRYRKAKYDDSARTDERWDLFVGARKKLSDQLGLGLEYLYVDNSSTKVQYDYARNRVALTATYEF